MTEKEDPRRRPSLVQMIGSVLAAFLGVQTNKNRERDFRSDAAGTFIILGLLGTIVFVLAIITLVKMVLNIAGV